MCERLLTVRMHCEFVDDLHVFDDIPTFLVKEVDANRPHYQGFVKYSKTLDNLRKLIKSKNPRLFGNQSYSVKEMRDDNEQALFRYYCKGTKDTPPEVILNSYVLQDVSVFYDQYWSQNKSIETKRKETNLYKRIFNEPLEDLSISGVVHYVIQWSIDHDKLLTTGQIKSLTESYLLRHSSWYRRAYTAEVISKITGYTPPSYPYDRIHIREEEYRRNPPHVHVLEDPCPSRATV